MRYIFLKILPKRYLSHLVGRLAHAAWPLAFHRELVKWFIKRYGVKVEEAEHSLDEYKTLGAFFTRNLKAGIRPLASGVVSPVDGRVSEWGDIKDRQLFQAKGLFYSLDELIGGSSKELLEQFRSGFFMTFYLAPGDYHQIHSPVSGVIARYMYFPGELWPVNAWSVSRVPCLFGRNERVVTIVETEGGPVAVVKVGATNVGAIQLAYDDLRTNQAPHFPWSQRKAVEKKFSSAVEVKAGDKLGTFRMGSTVILVFARGAFECSLRERGCPIKFGEKIGDFLK